MKKMKQWLTTVLLLCIAVCLPTGAAAEAVYVGGMPFGVKFFAQGITIVGFTEIETEDGSRTPAYDAGLRIHDVITRVNGTPVKSSAELVERVESTEEAIEITYLRDGAEQSVTFLPQCSLDGKRKTGMWIRDTTAGIGTVTYIDPATGAFGGLGHGICDSETGALIPMERGTVVDVQICGITRGVAGSPGELKGYFSSDKAGVLIGNTPCGVHGVFAAIPALCTEESPMEIGTRASLHEGEATIRCTLDENAPETYTIRIDAINRDSTDNRSFSITVTDAALLEKTGGIVQGMSGSPIIQDGKLVGAVTHVLVGDPAKGYGIFIENMLAEASGIK